MSADLPSPRFWEGQDLADELQRVAAICRGCRRCAAYCPAFSTLLENLDGASVAPKSGGRGAGDLGPWARVVDGCFQCQRCLLNCPYAPPQEEAVDFPHLMLRALLVRRREEGPPPGESWLSRPDLSLALGSLTRPWSNWLLRRKFFRAFLERATGLDREQLVPAFEKDVLDPWFRKKERGFRRRVKGENGRVTLLCTCRLNYLGAETGRKIVEVLHHNGIAVDLPSTRCCGWPALEAGDWAGARQSMEENLRTLGRPEDSGSPVVVAEPVCSWMLRREYPRLSGSDQAMRLAGRTVDLLSYLWRLHRSGLLRRDFTPIPQVVAYHGSCHLRVQDPERPGPELLKLIPEIQVREIDGCCGMGAVWGMKKRNRPASLILGEPAGREIREAAADRIVSESGHAALRLQELSGRRVGHPVEILHQAYGLSG